MTRTLSRLKYILIAAILWSGPAPVAAQTPTVHLESVRVANVATTVTLGLHVTKPLGETLLPGIGEEDTSDTRPWLLVAGVGGGYSWVRGTSDGFTATGHGGLMRRGGGLVNQVGVVAYVNTRPLGVGPALRAQLKEIVDLQAGGMWLEKGRGFRWFVGGGISVEFLKDLFTR